MQRPESIRRDHLLPPPASPDRSNLMENRRTVKTWVMFAVLFVVFVTHGGAARPVRSGCDGMTKERNELHAHAPDAVAAAGPTGAGGNGVSDQKNFLPPGGVGMGAGMGGHADMGGYLGGGMPTLGGFGSGFGMGGGFGAGGGAGVGGIGGMGTGPLGGLGGLGVSPGVTGVPLPLP